MNKYLLFSLVSLVVVVANIPTTKELQDKVSVIQAPRVGLTSADLLGIKDPFIYLDRNKTTGAIITPKLSEIKKDGDLNLSGIMNGKAFINNNWLRTGEQVNGYTITSVDKNSVVFSKDDTIKRVFIDDKKQNLIRLQKGYAR